MKNKFIIIALLFTLTSCGGEAKDCSDGKYEYGHFNVYSYYEISGIRID